MRLLMPPRERLFQKAAELKARRDDLDPTGTAYAVVSEELDEVLADIFRLGEG